MMIDTLVKLKKNQDCSAYTQGHHDAWNRLRITQLQKLEGRVAREFWVGLQHIQDFIQEIPCIESISEFLYQNIGWRLLPVDGLLNVDNYFFLLSRCYFPVSIHLRDNKNLNYSPLPDLWHDVFGHVPLMFTPQYTDLIQYLGHRYIADPSVGEIILRVYWYTIEAGLCQESGNTRIYGASQLSSIEESEYAVSGKPQVLPFDLDKVIEYSTRRYEIQRVLFEIPSIDYLQHIRSQLEAISVDKVLVSSL